MGGRAGDAGFFDRRRGAQCVPLSIGWLVFGGILAFDITMMSHMRFLLDRRSGLLVRSVGIAGGSRHLA